jgi:hypothetical protein
LNVQIRVIPVNLDYLSDTCEILDQDDEIETSSVLYLLDKFARDAGMEKCELLRCSDEMRDKLDSDDPEDWMTPVGIGVFCVALQGVDYDYAADSMSATKMCEALKVAPREITHKYPIEEWA